MLIVLSQNSLDFALDPMCMCGSLYEELFASSITSGGCFVVVLSLLRVGPQWLIYSSEVLNVKTECSWSSGMHIHLQVYSPPSAGAEMQATLSESPFLNQIFLHG